MKTADNHHIKLNMPVYVRVGGEYPAPGRWRVRTMRVKSIGRVNIRLAPIKGQTGCTRKPEQLFADATIARGQ